MHVRDLHFRSGTVNQHRSPEAVSDGIRSVDDLDFVRRAQDHVAVLGFELPEIAGDGSHFAKHSRLYQTLDGNAVGVSLTPLRRRKRARRTSGASRRLAADRAHCHRKLVVGINLAESNAKMPCACQPPLEQSTLLSEFDELPGGRQTSRVGAIEPGFAAIDR